MPVKSGRGRTKGAARRWPRPLSSSKLRTAAARAPHPWGCFVLVPVPPRVAIALAGSLERGPRRALVLLDALLGVLRAGLDVLSGALALGLDRVGRVLSGALDGLR